MPMLGSANHCVADRYASTAPVATAETPKTMSRRRHVPPRSDIQMRPATRDMPMITGIEIVGSREPVVEPDRAVLLEEHRDPEDREREEEEREERHAVVEAGVLAQRRDDADR